MSRKESRQKRAQQARRWAALNNGLLLLGVLLIIALAFLGYRRLTRGEARMGEAIPLMANQTRMALGEETTYNSSPPTSGQFYDQTMPAGFYDENAAEATTLHFPQGHLVHNLIHGYVVIYYNCASYSGSCEDLKQALREVMDEDPAELIAFPWADMDEPIALTSYGRLLLLNDLDTDVIRQFIRANRNAPEAPESNLE